MDRILTCRLLPHSEASGPLNMARDEVLLERAVEGVASLRFYGWSEPTVSLGYFQSHHHVLEDPDLKQLGWVRRASGGDALVHHHEVTYALALPPGRDWQSGELWQRMHQVIVNALSQLGVKAYLFEPQTEDDFSGSLCYEHFTIGDVMIDNHKIVGSAQRKQKKAILQHGGVLLQQSVHTPTLPGIHELSQVNVSPSALIEQLTSGLIKLTGWRLEPSDWIEQEAQRADELVEMKYGTERWNKKR